MAFCVRAVIFATDWIPWTTNHCWPRTFYLPGIFKLKVLTVSLGLRSILGIGGDCFGWGIGCVGFTLPTTRHLVSFFLISQGTVQYLLGVCGCLCRHVIAQVVEYSHNSWILDIGIPSILLSGSEDALMITPRTPYLRKHHALQRVVPPHLGAAP